MKEIAISSKAIPANPRSKNYPAGASVVHTGGGGTVAQPGGGSNIDVLKTTDAKSMTDGNVLSSLRTLLEIRSRIIASTDTETEPSEENTLSSLGIQGLFQYILMICSESFLNKQSDDIASGVIRFARGLVSDAVSIFKKGASFGNFVPGISGANINENGGIEADDLNLRGSLSVPELRYNRVTVLKGKQVISVGGGATVKSVSKISEGVFLLTLKLEEGEPLSQKVDDILLSYWHDKNVTTGAFKGFREMKFRVTQINETGSIVVSAKPGSESIPFAGMVLAQVGSFSDKERQTYIMIDSTLGNNNITFFDDCNTWDVEPAQEKSWFGKKRNRTVAGVDTSNYSAVLQNIIMFGKIFQVDEITGDSVRVPLDKGEFVPGQRYAYYDRVSKVGSLFLCVNEKGTTAEPVDKSADWLKQVGGGVPGKDSTSYRLIPSASQIVIKPNGTTPLFVTVNCKKQTGDSPVVDCNDLFLAYRIIDAGVTKTSVTDNATYAQIAVVSKSTTSLSFRAYSSKTDAEAWNSNYIDNVVIGVVKDGSDGVDGTDGKSYEFVYRRTTNPSFSAPSAPDDAHTGWTNDPLGVDSTFICEWVSQRVKDSGAWSPFSTPSLWAKYAADGKPGEPGKPGESSTSYWLTSSGSSVSVAADGTVTPDKITVYCKKSVGGVVSECRDLYLRVRRYAYGELENSDISDSKRSSVIITPSKLHTSYVIRAYQTISDNNSWSDNYIAESVISLVKDGQNGNGSSTPGEPGKPGVPGTDSTSYWLTSPVSSIVYNSLGSPTPLFFQVTCKKQSGANPVSDCSAFYLAISMTDAGGTKITVTAFPASAVMVVASSKNMTRLSIRAYSSKTDAEAWNSNHATEYGISIVKNGTNGTNGAMPRMCGEYNAGLQYVYNSEYRDIMFYSFGGVNYLFQVKVYGSSVSVPPTSVNGDDNWESANKFSFVATDTLLADGANLAGLMFKDGILRSQDETNGVPNLLLNGKTGEISSRIGTFSGKINTPYLLLTKSDAVIVSTGVYMLRNNLNIAVRLGMVATVIFGCTIILPTDIKYNGAHVNILDFTYPPYTRSSYPTTVCVENGDMIGGTKDDSQSLEAQSEQASINVIGGEVKFHAVPAYDSNYQFIKVKWILEH